MDQWVVCVSMERCRCYGLGKGWKCCLATHPQTSASSGQQRETERKGMRNESGERERERDGVKTRVNTRVVQSCNAPFLWG